MNMRKKHLWGLVAETLDVTMESAEKSWNINQSSFMNLHMSSVCSSRVGTWEMDRVLDNSSDGKAEFYDSTEY